MIITVKTKTPTKVKQVHRTVKKGYSSMLVLPIKKQWFNMILNHDKKVEYRDITDYYIKRFSNYFEISEQALRNQIELSRVKNETVALKCISKEVILRNGYSLNSPSLVAKVRLSVGHGRHDWGADADKNYFCLEITGIKEIKNLKKKRISL